MVYERTLGEEKYVVVVNPGVKGASLNISSVGGKSVSVLATGKVVYKSGRKTDVIKASGISAAIFKVERQSSIFYGSAFSCHRLEQTEQEVSKEAEEGSISAVLLLVVIL